MSLLAAVVVAVSVSAVAVRLGWLTWAGGGAACMVGAAVLEGGGMRGGLLLGIFFLSGSLLTSWSERAGLVPIGTKGGRRDARQVGANGTWAAVGAVVIPTAPFVGWSILAGAVAAAQADTWATEIGARARRSPRLITSGERVERGMSGAVSLLGTAGGVAGAATVAATAWMSDLPSPAAWAGLLGGCVGMTVDSIIGATGQGIFAQGPDETADAGQPNLLRGWAWCTNDVVNLVGTGAGAAVGLGLGLVWTIT